MAEIDAIGRAGTADQSAANAFGMGFEDLLRIVLTQLTYQDPLKPIENFEFVSQLAQFSQIQQAETLNDRILGILQAEATNQATTVLGHVVEIPSGAGVTAGRVTQVSFQSGEPRLSILTADGRTLDNILLSGVSRIRAEN